MLGACLNSATLMDVHGSTRVHSLFNLSGPSQSSCGTTPQVPPTHNKRAHSCAYNQRASRAQESRLHLKVTGAGGRDRTGLKHTPSMPDSLKGQLGSGLTGPWGVPEALRGKGAGAALTGIGRVRGQHPYEQDHLRAEEPMTPAYQQQGIQKGSLIHGFSSL